MTSNKHTAKGAATRAQILDYFRAYVQAHGYEPSIKEIVYHVGCSRSNVKVHLNRLAQEGELVKRPPTAHGYRLGVPVS